MNDYDDLFVYPMNCAGLKIVDSYGRWFDVEEMRAKWHRANIGIIEIEGNLMNHSDFADEIVPRAAELYGGSSEAMSRQSRDIIRDTIRGLSRESAKWQTALEKACGQAVEEWYAAKAAAEAAPAPVVEAPAASGGDSAAPTDPPTGDGKAATDGAGKSGAPASSSAKPPAAKEDPKKSGK